MADPHSVSLDFWYDPATHSPAADSVKNVVLSLYERKERHQKQAETLQRVGQLFYLRDVMHPGVQPLKAPLIALDADPLIYQGAWYNVDQIALQIKTHNGDRQFQEKLFLFNVIIALEWNPGDDTIKELRTAMRKASNFLFDVTNGYMAIGQVVIGGPALMDVADIQIMASNRFHPRAWLDALNCKEKFKPIRVGRGLWKKDESLQSWGTDEGAHALVHEWGHYAFALRDEYLRATPVGRSGPADHTWERQENAPPPSDLSAPADGPPWSETEVSLVVPEIAVVRSVMADTRISEFADLDVTFAFINQRYTHVTDTTPRQGPELLPLALPAILELALPEGATPPADLARTTLRPSQPQEAEVAVVPAQQLVCALSGKRAPRLETHWLYLLKAPSADGAAERMIAQGKLSDANMAAGTFRLLGADPGDRLVMISQVDDDTVVIRARLEQDANGALLVGDWQDATPPGIAPNSSLFVDVIPMPLATGVAPMMDADLRVQVVASVPPESVHIFPSGAGDDIRAGWEGGPLSASVTVPHLDGHVLLHWAPAEDGRERLFISSYSQGGGPRTSSGGILPITAGSADGNAMVFFNANLKAPSETNQAASSSLRLVTTTTTVGQQRLDLGPGMEARSYLFSLASNGPMDAYKAALVLYYDKDASSPDGELLVYRWDGSGWQRLTTFIDAQQRFVAIPLGCLDDPQKTELETAPALTGAEVDGRVERYRVFVTPREASESAATAGLEAS